jgi:hypothetical protein
MQGKDFASPCDAIRRRNNANTGHTQLATTGNKPRQNSCRPKLKLLQRIAECGVLVDNMSKQKFNSTC